MIVLNLRLISVSYTHLDVYKRQEIGLQLNGGRNYLEPDMRLC